MEDKKLIEVLEQLLERIKRGDPQAKEELIGLLVDLRLTRSDLITIASLPDDLISDRFLDALSKQESKLDFSQPTLSAPLSSSLAFIDKGFSSNATRAFERLIWQKRLIRRGDVLLIHFSEDLLLSDLLDIEFSVDELYRTCLEISSRDYEEVAPLRYGPLLYVDKFTHPSSTEAVFRIAAENVAAIMEPTLLGIVQDLVINSLFYVLDKFHDRRTIAVQKSKDADHSDEVELVQSDEAKIGTVIEKEPPLKEAAHRVVETTITKNRYIGFHNGRLLLGTEEKTTTTETTKVY